MTLAPQNNSMGQTYYYLQFTDEETEVCTCRDHIAKNWQICSTYSSLFTAEACFCHSIGLPYKVLKPFVDMKGGQEEKGTTEDEVVG